MTKLTGYRERLNLTQEELSMKSGISVRTIQRIESGIEPKGHTLRALAKALDINEKELIKNKDLRQESNPNLVHLINLSSLILVFIPVVSFVIPLIIAIVKKQFNSLTKQIITIQILWAIVMIMVYTIGSIVFVTELGRDIGMLLLLLLILANTFIILRNSIELKKKNKLYFKLKV